MSGWDDEDDWVRRDHGPRPHVPDHGRRPLLMALPIFLITIAAVVAVLIAGCGADDEMPIGKGTTPPAQSTPANSASPADAKAVAKKVSESAALFSGMDDPDAFADVSCEPGSAADEFRCSYSGMVEDANHMMDGEITVRRQSDGSIGKVLGEGAPAAGQPTAEKVAELLKADDLLHSQQKNFTYRCAASTAINPDGSSAGTSIPGFRCVFIAKGKPAVQRYVQFGADGTAVRDFEVQEP